MKIASALIQCMIRTGNEDAFALLHNCESRQDDVAESALLLLANGMGGYEAGEVAAVCYIASAYCPGIDLGHWLRQNPDR